MNEFMLAALIVALCGHDFFVRVFCNLLFGAMAIYFWWVHDVGWPVVIFGLLVVKGLASFVMFALQRSKSDEMVPKK